MNCKTCGSPVMEGAAFCLNCGARVDTTPEGDQTVMVQQGAPAQQPPYTPAPQQPQPTYGYGGGAHGSVPYDPMNGGVLPPRKNRSKLLILIIVAVLLVAVLAVTLVFVLGDDDGKASSVADGSSHEESDDSQPFNSGVAVLPPNMGGGEGSDTESDTDSAVSSPDYNPNIPTGYTEYSNGYISFAYPSDWTVTETSFVIIQNSDSTLNIATAYEPASDYYETMDAEQFEASFKPMLEAQGITVLEYDFDFLVNANGEEVNIIYVYEEILGEELYQTLMSVTSGDTTQLVTVTEKVDGGDLAQNVFDSIKVLK